MDRRILALAFAGALLVSTAEVSAKSSGGKSGHSASHSRSSPHSASQHTSGNSLSASSPKSASPKTTSPKASGGNVNNATAAPPVSVKGYTKKDGTYVAPYKRSAPDKSKENNYSTKGNVNPYTGKVGTKEPTSK